MPSSWLGRRRTTWSTFTVTSRRATPSTGRIMFSPESRRCAASWADFRAAVTRHRSSSGLVYSSSGRCTSSHTGSCTKLSVRASTCTRSWTDDGTYTTCWLAACCVDTFSTLPTDSEEHRDPRTHAERISRRKVDIRRRLERMIGLLPGLRDTREAEAIAPWVTLRREAARHDLAPYAARVGELRLAPVGVREVEQRERRLDVPPAPACDEVEERVAARDEAPILDRGAVVEEAEAERGREAVAEVEREAAVHEERRRERDRVTVAEARVGVGEVVVGGEPACHPEEALDVDAVAPARARRPEVAPGRRLLGSDVEARAEVEENVGVRRRREDQVRLRVHHPVRRAAADPHRVEVRVERLHRQVVEAVEEVDVAAEPHVRPDPVGEEDLLLEEAARAALVDREPVHGEEAAALDLAVEGDVDLIVARLDLEPARRGRAS